MRRAAMKTYWKELILGTFYMLATYVLFYLMATFSLSYGRAATTAALPGFGQDDKSSVLLIIGVVYFDIFTMASARVPIAWPPHHVLPEHSPLSATPAPAPPSTSPRCSRDPQKCEPSR